MNLRIEQSGQDFLVVDGDTLDGRTVIDAYATRAEAENFLQFIGQCPADLDIPVPAVSENLCETCAMCGCPLYTDTPGLCGACKEDTA